MIHPLEPSPLPLFMRLVPEADVLRVEVLQVEAAGAHGTRVLLVHRRTLKVQRTAGRGGGGHRGKGWWVEGRQAS